MSVSVDEIMPFDNERMAQDISDRSEDFLVAIEVINNSASYRYCTAFVRRIYTTIILGTALLNFGTRANSFGHCPLDLHCKIRSCFFNVDFWNGTPETRTALLNLCVPALI